MSFKRGFYVALAGSVLFGVACPAFALDGKDVATKLSALMTAEGYTLGVQDASVNGDSVTLKGVTLGFAFAGPQGSKVPVPDITLNGVSEQAGGYRISKAIVGDIDYQGKNMHASASDFELEGISVPAKIEPGTLAVAYWADAVHSGPVKLVIADRLEMGFAASSFVYTQAADEQSILYAGRMSGVKIRSIIGSAEMLRDLGFDEIDGEIAAHSTWTIADGKYDVAETADFTNLGKFDVKFSISGDTLQFSRSFKDKIKAARTATGYDPRQFSVLKAMGSSLGQLTLNAVSIRFDDAGITNKILDLQARRRGMDRAHYTDVLKRMSSVLLPSMGQSDLRQRIILALGSYLDEPKSLEVSIKPSVPMVISQVIETARRNPGDMDKTININVTAGH
jgi:hypothetical protein